MLESLFQYIGETAQIHTLVDYYQYIKAVEYLICIGFFIAFHSFYKHVINHKPEQQTDS